MGGDETSEIRRRVCQAVADSVADHDQARAIEMPTTLGRVMSMVLRVFAALFVSLAVVASAAASAKDAASGQFEILTLSNRADLISGGDALVEVRVPGTVPLDQVTLWLNGLNVTAAFRTDTAARTMRGVLTGLVGGRTNFSRTRMAVAAAGRAVRSPSPIIRSGTGATGLADDALGLRDAHAYRRNRAIRRRRPQAA